MLITTPNDGPLLTAARQWQCREPLGAAVLAALAADRGIDFATAVAYHHVRSSAQHEDFIRRVEAIDDASKASGAAGLRLVIVPGAFFREYPAAGGDGRMLVEQLSRLGYSTTVL